MDTDLFTIIMMILFFVLPVIQQVFGKKGQEPGTPSDDPFEGAPDDYPRVEERSRVGTHTLEPAPDANGDAWSGGWGSWPGAEEMDSEKADKKVRAASPSPPPVARTHVPAPRERAEPQLVLREFPSRLRVPAPEPRKPTALHVPGLQVTKPPVARPRVRRSATRGGAPGLHPSLSMLRNARPDQLRELFVVSEILGPPRGSQDLE